MKLLVAGGAGVDAGKTTFSVGLVHATGATGYKPRAGNDYWEDHDDVRRAVAGGRLYGKDAAKLAAASPGDPAPEAINAVHRLWLPTPGRGTGLLGREGRAFVVDRVGSGDDAAWLRNATVELPDRLVGTLPLDAAESVESLRGANDAMARLHRPALDAMAERIAAEERAVVESYADIARPLTGFEPDAVAVVEPRRVRVYDGTRFARACEVAGGSPREGRLEERVGNVVDLLDPRARHALPALSAAERDDPAAIASAYEPAYDSLLSVADG